MNRNDSTAGPLTPDQLARLERWQGEDPCFAVLNAIRLACLAGSADHVDRSIELYQAHYEHCGACTENVLIRSANASDQFEKRIHVNLALLWQLELMKFMGGDFEISETNRAWHITIRYPSWFKESWGGLELFLARDQHQESWLTLDVLDDDAFRNPGPHFSMFLCSELTM